MNEPTRTPLEIEIPTGDGLRLLVRPWTNTAGRLLVTIAPQIAGKDGAWRLQHSGLAVAPGHALQLAAALSAMARQAVKS